MKRNTKNILDVHTHKPEGVSDGKSIINYPLLSDSPLHLPHAKSLEFAVDRGLYIKELLGFLKEGESLYDTLSDNTFYPLKGCYYSAGIHPWELTERNAKHQLKFLKGLFTKKQFVAVGEAGLDKMAAASMEFQITMFKEQVALSERRKLPLIIHCVKAMEELLAVKKELKPEQPWIWHGFRGTPEQAKQLLKKGFYLSFGEYYPDDTLVSVPADRLFLETDTADIDIEIFLHQAAIVRGVEVDDLRRAIHENIQKVFFKG